MAVLLQLLDAHKSYGHQVLLDGAEVTLTDAHKVGFIGRNGAGKSTLCRILLGDEELERGEVIRHPKLRIGYLRQHDPFLPGETVLEFLMRDSGQPDWRCGEVAGRFELKGAYLAGPVQKLSGGWQTRVKLAALLLHDPNLLLLDEPTNFLDLRTQILLEHFLREFRQAALIVSHDRAFLAATCTQTLELSRGKLTLYPGPVEAFLEYQRERREHDERVNAAILAKRRQLETFIDKNRARASTASRAKSKGKQLERLQAIDVAGVEATVRIRPPEVEPRKGPALRCIDLAIGYSEHEVARDIDVEVEHGSRAAVVGDNGQGKTTFLRTVVESLPPLAGQVRWGYGCQIGVYAQHVYTSLPEKWSVLEYLEHAAAAGTKSQAILDLAGAFLFRGDEVRKRISVLSGGERARLCLAGLLLSNYNVLVLDEPGNHLDVDTVDALAEALNDYRGTVLFTSHDRHFMKRVATSVVEVRAGRVVNYRGDYDAYLYYVNREIEEGERELAAKASPGKAQPAPRNDRNSRKEHQQRQRDLRKEITALERSIARLDERKRALNTQLLAATDPDEALRLHEELTAIAKELAPIEERWCQLQESVEADAES